MNFPLHDSTTTSGHNVSEPAELPYHRPTVGQRYSSRWATVVADALLVWRGFEPDSQLEEIFARWTNGDHRQTAICVSEHPGTYDAPVAALNPDGADILWIEDGQRLRHASIEAEKVSARREVVASKSWLRESCVNRTAGAELWVAVIESSDGADDWFRVLQWANGKWGEVASLQRAGFCARPDLLADGEGGFELAFDCYDEGRYSVEVWTWRDEKWTRTLEQRDETANCLLPRLTRLRAGQTWLSYLHERIVERDGVPGRAASARVQRRDETGWGAVDCDGGPVAHLYTGWLPKTRYFGYNGLRRNPRLIATDDGAIHLVWEAQRDEAEVWDNVRNGHLLAMTWDGAAWSGPTLWHNGGCAFVLDHQWLHPTGAVAGAFTSEQHRDDGDDFEVFTGDPRHAQPLFAEPLDHWQGWRDAAPVAREEERPVWEVGGRTYRLYWGDFHAHSIFSPDAEGWPDELHHFARDFAALDFAGITDNDFYPDKPLLSSESLYQRQLARRLSKPNRFLAYAGYEWSYHRSAEHDGYNHRSIIYADEHEARIVRRIDARGNSEEEFGAALREMNVFAHAHHGVYYPLQTPQEANVEVTSGWQINIETMPGTHDHLNAGHRFGFIGGGDSHRMLPGSNGALVAVWAEELTREAIADALRQRRCYATNGGRAVIRLRANGALMGQVTPAASHVRFEVEVEANVPLQRVSLIRNGETIHEFDCSGHALRAEWTDEQTPSTGAWYYLRVEDATPYRSHPHNVCQAVGPLAWSSPIWIEGA